MNAEAGCGGSAAGAGDADGAVGVFREDDAGDVDAAVVGVDLDGGAVEQDPQPYHAVDRGQPGFGAAGAE